MTIGAKSGERKGTRQLRGRRGTARAGWFATLVAVLFALSWQSVVTQTHQHFNPGTVSAAAAAKADGADPGRSDKRSPSDLPANCPICRAIAHADQVVLSAPVLLAAPAQVIAWRAEASPLGETLVRRSHAWRSRAPPLQLQA